jgi:bleomycin hydrolase
MKITNNDINKLAVNGESKNNLDTYFSNKVESKGISNQRSSGRCWLFTGLNVFRAQAIAKYDMGDFQFSQNLSSGINWRKRTFSYRASSILV